MNAEQVELFLIEHPQFFAQLFERRPELLESIQVPHPYGGRAIPLSERQILTLREKVRLLEGKLGELIQFGEENDAIGEKVHRLASALLAANDPPAAVNALHFHLREDFAVPHVALRIWGQPRFATSVEGAPVSEAQRLLAQTMGSPQCGPAEGNPFLACLGEAAGHVRSLALVPLGATQAFGMLVLGSEDERRFYPEMGTLFLGRVGELAAAALAPRA